VAFLTTKEGLEGRAVHGFNVTDAPSERDLELALYAYRAGTSDRALAITLRPGGDVDRQWGEREIFVRPRGRGQAFTRSVRPFNAFAPRATQASPIGSLA
jgi:hypothetical protein